MATYTELFGLVGANENEPLRQKIVMALCIKANTIAKSGSPTAAQLDFARAALRDPTTFARTIMNYILAEYNAQTIAAITGADDAAVQTAVNAAVDTMLGV